MSLKTPDYCDSFVNIFRKILTTSKRGMFKYPCTFIYYVNALPIMIRVKEIHVISWTPVYVWWEPTMC